MEFLRMQTLSKGTHIIIEKKKEITHELTKEVLHYFKLSSNKPFSKYLNLHFFETALQQINFRQFIAIVLFNRILFPFQL